MRRYCVEMSLFTYIDYSQRLNRTSGGQQINFAQEIKDVPKLSDRSFISMHYGNLRFCIEYLIRLLPNNDDNKFHHASNLRSYRSMIDGYCISCIFPIIESILDVLLDFQECLAEIEMLQQHEKMRVSVNLDLVLDALFRMYFAVDRLGLTR